MKKLYNTISKELKENENIFIIRKENINLKKGIMEEHTIDSIFNVYSYYEIVLKVWHEEGLCIIIK